MQKNISTNEQLKNLLQKYLKKANWKFSITKTQNATEYEYNFEASILGGQFLHHISFNILADSKMAVSVEFGILIQNYNKVKMQNYINMI